MDKFEYLWNIWDGDNLSIEARTIGANYTEAYDSVVTALFNGDEDFGYDVKLISFEQLTATHVVV